jgi:benzodiazapine receptor
MDTQDIVAIFAFPVVLLLFSLPSSLLTSKNLPWYDKLKRPDMTPPNWVFGPVWCVLYILIGISGYLIWAEKKSIDVYSTPWLCYISQLILNYSWTTLFFGFHWLLASALEIGTLLILIIINIILFTEINPIAGYLLLPYFCWVGYATYLNWGFWVKNKDKAHKK